MTEKEKSKGRDQNSNGGGIEGVVIGTPKPPRLVLHGPPGIGKSTFGADAPSPIIIPTEDGVDALPVPQFRRLTTWSDLVDAVQKVATADHQYETVVVDTINGAAELAAQDVCSKMYGGQWTAKRGDGGFLAWGQGWKATSEQMRALLDLLDKCRSRGMGVILLAHTGLQNVRHPTDGEYTRFAPEMERPVWARVCKWADVVLHADYEYQVLPGRGGSRGRVVGTSTRIVRAAGSAAEEAKTRVGYDLPETFGLSYDEFAAALGRGRESVLDEVRELWHYMDEEQEAKVIAWLGISGPDDLGGAPYGNVKKLLNRLRQLAAEHAEEEEEEEGTTNQTTTNTTTKGE